VQNSNLAFAVLLDFHMRQPANRNLPIQYGICKIFKGIPRTVFRPFYFIKKAIRYFFALQIFGNARRTAFVVICWVKRTF